MTCEAHSAREYTGIAAWVREVVAPLAPETVPVYWQGEDIRSPELAYWGLTEGNSYGATHTEYEGDVITSRRFTLTIAVATAYTYILVVGTTPIEVVVSAVNVQADIPALFATAWQASGLGLPSNGVSGTGGYTLASFGNDTFAISGAAAKGGLPVFEYGWGFAQTSETNAGRHLISIEEIRHSFMATYWGQKRGRGIAKRVCQDVLTASDRPDVYDRLLRYTGQVAVLTTPTVLDMAALGTGDPAALQDVATIEIVVTALVVSALPIDIAAGVNLHTVAFADVAGDTLSSDTVVTIDAD